LRTSRPRHMLGTYLSQFLQEFSLAKARQLVEHFNESKHTIKTILEREHGLWKFSRRWLPHSLSDSQKVDRMRKAKSILDVLREQTDKYFNWMRTSDDSWFVYLYLSDHMFVSGWESIIPRKKQTIASRNVLPTIFSAEWVWFDDWIPTIWLDMHQEYFIQNILSGLVNEKKRIWRRDRVGWFFVHIDNSICHNRRMITQKISDAKLERRLHRVYSPDMSQ
jgi:hypothetical protein